MLDDRADIQRLADLIKGAERVAVVTHTHPDGDAIGSSTAIWRCLRETFGKKTDLIMVEPVPENIDFLLEGVELSGPEALVSCDLLFVMDLNSVSRTGVLEDHIRSCKAVKVLVDHHLNPCRDEFDLVFSTPDVSSASEHLFRILKELCGGIGNLPLKVLESLMTGMTTDTNNFANSVFAGTLEMASELIGAGVDRNRIIDLLYKRHRINRLRAFAYFLGEKLVLKGGLAYIVMTREELDRFDIREGELDGLVNEPLGVGDVKLSMTVKEDGENWRLSLRSKKGVSANDIARNFFNGGGHELAAGGRLSLEVNPAEYIEKVVKL